jgi:hypothetical protein
MASLPESNLLKSFSPSPEITRYGMFRWFILIFYVHFYTSEYDQSLRTREYNPCGLRIPRDFFPKKLGDSLASTDRIEGVGLFEGFT